MFISFLVRVNGTKVVDVFDAKGQYVGKVAVNDIENVFNWWIFLALFVPGVFVLGYM